MRENTRSLNSAGGDNYLCRKTVFTAVVTQFAFKSAGNGCFFAYLMHAGL